MPEYMNNSLFIIANFLASGRINKQIGNRLSMHGLSFSEYMLMQQLADGHELSRIELADRLSMSASGITRMLQPLEKNLVVESVKNPRDARQSKVKLTASGQQLFEDASVSFIDKCNDITRLLSSKELDKLVELLANVA